MSSSKSVTQLLSEWREGKNAAFEELLPFLYDQLRHRVRAYIRGEWKDHTLQTTALISEAYIRRAEYHPLRYFTVLP